MIMWDSNQAQSDHNLNITLSLITLGSNFGTYNKFGIKKYLKGKGGSWDRGVWNSTFSSSLRKEDL